MHTEVLPNIWTASQGQTHLNRLRLEAMELSRSHSLPASLDQWKSNASTLKNRLLEKLKIGSNEDPLQIEVHRKIPREGYDIEVISFSAAPGIRVTGNLYVPQGDGPFPAVLNLHGHFPEGKTAANVQARGHILALNGFVVLTVDAPGAGERGANADLFEYHGGFKAAALLLAGDSLLGWQVRDNKRALDVLESLSFVDSTRIGVTGASGGGNQTMWLAALDSRVKVVVPVVSVGSFSAYVTQRNCMCETLPGGLAISEEWAVLGLIAPRPLLILNSIHDEPAFGLPAFSSTCSQVREIYDLFDAWESFDHRAFDTSHGYWPPMLQAMLGWMQYWLKGQPSASPRKLPDWSALPAHQLLCFESGQRPDRYFSYDSNRVALLGKGIQGPQEWHSEKSRELAKLLGWKAPGSLSELIVKKHLPNGLITATIHSSRSLQIPVVLEANDSAETKKIKIILSPAGKRAPFVSAQWKQLHHESTVIASLDLPGTGELAWETDKVAQVALHDTARACLWLGYTLIGEWAEVIASLCFCLARKYPSAEITLVAEKEAAFAALLARAVEPKLSFHLIDYDLPDGLTTLMNGAESLAWIVPGFLEWGDLPLLRKCRAKPLSSRRFA